MQKQCSIDPCCRLSGYHMTDQLWLGCLSRPMAMRPRPDSITPQPLLTVRPSELLYAQLHQVCAWVGCCYAQTAWICAHISNMVSYGNMECVALWPAQHLLRTLCTCCVDLIAVHCCAVLCTALLCCALLCCAVLCCAVLCRAVPCCAMMQLLLQLMCSEPCVTRCVVVKGYNA